MPKYQYKARDNSGKVVRGTMEATTKENLVDKLNKMGYMTTQVKEARTGLEGWSLLDRLRPVGAADMIIFYVQLSNMINAGITILAALRTLCDQIENKKLKSAVGNVAMGVEGGESFSEALARESRIFPKLFISMVKAGEVSGHLDLVLMRYATFYEGQEDLKQKVTGALFYPLILLTIGIGVVLLIVTFVIPQFVTIYMKVGVKLPLITLIVYNIGTFIKGYWYILISAVAVMAALIGYYFKTQNGSLFRDTLKLKMPVVGTLYRQVAIIKFSRTLATLLGSGVSILESLDITKEVIGNEVLARVVASLRQYVEKGERMSELLKVSEEFPPDVVQMVSVGEETGKLDTMLNKIADFYDITVSYAIKKLITVIEPLFLIMMGCLVGFIMASVLLPMFDMVKVLKK